ncbi:MAG: UvrD-helicase domain-containing protein [Kiritimatiellae bacterium]|nr:UvrD-helicase domain-containing protein [Kiritimatiellia bacterium]
MSNFRAYQAISALAGAGKTYRLTSRYLALLAQGFAPSSIVAITFTRKAAGEIFDRIVQRLAAADRSEPSRLELEQALRAELGDPAFEVTPRDVRAWLRALLDDMPRLRIGTIDSLFAGILKAFALELGIPSRTEILDGPALEHAREEALARAFERVAADVGVQSAYLEAFKQATSGEGKEVRSPLVEMIENGHELFLECPEPEAWGHPERMWTGPEWWNSTPETGYHEQKRDAEQLARQLNAPGLDSRYVKAWKKFLEHVRECDWDAVLDLPFAQRLFDARARSGADGSVELSYYDKTYRLEGESAAMLRALLAATVRSAIDRLLKATNGMRSLLSAYEDSCQTELRGRGRLSFSDVPLLLQRVGDECAQTSIAYRLDGRIDHWMIDEFQDTNARQWRVIGRLADEVIQSTESDRSFFYVGDVKQAIYAWRGGESTLFEAVHAKYDRRFGEVLKLNESWRSSPVVLEAVNRAFGNVLSMGCLGESYPDVARTWAERWVEHQPAACNKNLPGQVEIIEMPGKAKDERGHPARIAQVCDVVRGLLDRGVESIGVLVRINTFGDRVADALRSREIPVRREMNPRLCDNGAISAILSLLTWADHPGDAFAGPHVRNSPLWPVLRNWWEEQGIGDGAPDPVTRWTSAVREGVAREGVAGWLGALVDRCRDAGLFDDIFIRMRVGQLLDAASDFDRMERGGPGEFARWAGGMEVRDPVADGRVSVMTVHKAKGLEFDAVILPDLEGARRQWNYTRSGDLTLWSGEKREGADPVTDKDPAGRWVFPLPRKGLETVEPLMSKFARKVRDLKVAEELCLLYVAMTRARQGLYIVIEQPPKSESALYAATFLREAMGSSGDNAREGSRRLYSQGQADWPERTRHILEAERREETPAAGIVVGRFAAVPAKGAATRRRLDYRTPSGEERAPGWMPAQHLFSRGKSSASARGVALHDLFSRMEWLGPDAGRIALAQYEMERGPCDADVRDEFLRTLESPEAAAVLGRPGEGAEVWREQAFEFVENGAWISGRMDRVVVERNSSGRPVAAVVVDFKSDRVEEGEAGRATLRERYAPQLEMYRNVVAGLLGLDRKHVRAELLHTPTGRRVMIPSA